MRCAITGNSPLYLGGYNNYNGYNVRTIKSLLKDDILDLINSGYTEFMTGGQLGIELEAFFVIEELKELGYTLNNMLALPFKEQSIKWHMDNRLRHNLAISKADEIIYVDTIKDYKIRGIKEGTLNPAKYVKRNYYIRDNSDTLLSYYISNTEDSFSRHLTYLFESANKEIIDKSEAVKTPLAMYA